MMIFLLQNAVHIFWEVSGGIALLLIATIGFDVLHVFLHRFASSRWALLRSLGGLHTTHHQFLDSDLMIHEELIRANVWRHVIPEFITQLLLTFLLAGLFPWLSVAVAIGLEVSVFIFIMWGKPGFDVNHHPVDQLLPYRPLYFCVPEYHLLHHHYPSAYFSSWIKTLDHVLGTGTAIKNRRVLLTGAETSFGKALLIELKNHGANIKTVSAESEKSVESFVGLMGESDILVLCHVLDINKPDSGNCYSHWIDIFYAQHQSSRFPVEVWALASVDKKEQRFAKEWFKSGKVIYRYVALNSQSADAVCAKTVMKNICRGFNFVPARWNLVMLGDYWQLVWK